MTDLSAYAYNALTNPRISSDDWNNLLTALATAIDAAAAGVVTPQQYGAVADGETDDGQAFADAIAHLKSIASNDATIYKGSPRLFIPAGHYYLGTTTLDITHTLIIEGEGTGLAGGASTKLRWAADTTGIRVQRYNTSGAGTNDGASHYAGDATIIQNLQLVGAFTDLASEGDYHGIHLKARALVRDCFIQNWQGNGIHIVAYGDDADELTGNANQFQIERVSAWACQHGIFIDGSDANAGYTTGCDLSYCRQWGLWDSSFLGNNHSNHHSTNCGFADNGLSGPPFLPPTVVAHNGHHYYVKVGQEDWCSTNAPTGSATSNQGWLYLSDGGTLGASIPAWNSGDTYRTGGPYRVGEPDPADDGNQGVVLIGCYAEGGSAPPQFGASGTLVIGGTWGTGVGGWPAIITAGSTGVNVNTVSVTGSLSAKGSSSYFGSTSTANQDLAVHMQNSGPNGTLISFETWDGAGGQLYDDGYIFGEPGIGLVFNGRSTTQAIRLRANGTNIAKIGSTGLDIYSGKVLLVNGTQVVGAQGAAVADATDAASTMARLNDLLARLRTHGLIAT